MKNLPLKIGQIYLVEIDNTEGANSRGCQIEGCRRSKTSSTDAQNPRSFESMLTLGGNLGHDQMARVPLQFSNAQPHHTASIVINDASLHGMAYINTTS